MSDVSSFGREADRIAHAVRHWSPARWRVRAPGLDRSRGDVMHAAIQAMADLTATLENEPRRAVPRLRDGSGLAEQWQVVAADFVRLAPDAEALAVAREHVAHLRATLLRPSVGPDAM